jgi:hypothetical protein
MRGASCMGMGGPSASRPSLFDLAAQREAVMSYLDGGRWALVDEFTEIESGKRNDRPELVKALAACLRLS